MDNVEQFNITGYNSDIDQLIETLSVGIRTKDFCISDGDITILFEKKEKSGAKPLLTQDQKEEICRLYMGKVYTQAELAKNAR